MYEIKKVRDKATLIDTYREAFRERFGRPPVININTANEVLSWALDELGFDEAESFIKKYVALKDNWLEGQGFPLEQFRRSINRLITQEPPRQASPSFSSRGVQIQLTFYCDNSPCRNSFTLVCYGDEIDKRHLCPACKERSCKVVA